MIFLLALSPFVPARVAHASFGMYQTRAQVHTNPGLRIVDCGVPITILPDADSWIDQNSASTNKGTDGSLKVQSKAGSTFRALVRFVLPDVPQGCVIGSAALRLYAASATAARTSQVLRLKADWSEATVNWNDQPATIGPAGKPILGPEYSHYMLPLTRNNLIYIEEQ